MGAVGSWGTNLAVACCESKNQSYGDVSHPGKRDEGNGNSEILYKAAAARLLMGERSLMIQETIPARGGRLVNSADGSLFELDECPVSRRRFQMTVGKMMTFILVTGCLLGFVILAERAIQNPPPRRAMCMNNLKQIGLALHNYQTEYGAFPPAYIADEAGRPMHSWRVLILPYMDEQDLYDDYDFSEPWNGPHNSRLLAKMPRLFSCPTRDWAATSRPSLTSYVLVTGRGTMFPGPQSSRLDQVTDGSPNTLMVTEASNVQIPWTKPDDLDARSMSFRINDPKRPSISSQHPNGANALFADLACRFLPESTTAYRLRALFTIAGGEPVTWD
jgi:prepilin-type processing-associated H-X9-DG protein